MADSLGDIKIEVTPTTDVKKLMEILTKAGGKNINVISTTDKFGKSTVQQVTGKVADTNKVNAEIMAQKWGGRSVTNQPGSDSSLSNFDKIFNRKNLMSINRSFFMMQMATLGVAFSFQSLQNQMLSVFSGLSDLGDMFSTVAEGSAFGSAMGATTPDINKILGINENDMVNAFMGFKTITDLIQSLVNGLAVKILTPTMVQSILDVIGAIATELAKPEVVKAVQDIVMAVLDTIKQIVPLLPAIANVVTALSDSGLLGVLVAIVLISPYLLSFFSLLQFGFQAIIFVLPALLTLLSAVEVLLGGTLLASIGAIIIVVGAFALVIDFLKNLFYEFGVYGISLQAVWAALGDTLSDVINFIAAVIKTLTLGAVDFTHSNSSSVSSGNTTSSKTEVTNYYNYGNISSDQKASWSKYT